MNSESDRERDASRSEHREHREHRDHRDHRQQRPHPLHQQNAKPSSSLMRPLNHAGHVLAGDPSHPYALAAALAMAAGEDNGGPFHRQSPFMTGGEGSTPPPPDNAALIALYHSPLWQAAIRQQQLQIINHLANIGNPFMSAQGLASSGASVNVPPLSPFSPSFGPGSAYSDYIAKYAKAQHATTTSTSSSPTMTSPKLHTPTSGSTNTTTAQAAVAARLAANLMAAAGGKPPSSSPDYTASISTTSNILSSAADSRGGGGGGGQNLRYGLDKLDPLLSQSMLSSSLGAERKDNNNGKHSPPSVPTSIAPIAQSLIGAGRGSGQRGSSGRGRGRGVASHPGSTSDGLNGRDKVFTCKICNRSFGYKHVLQNHERTHTGEKPFECRVCHKRFTRDHHLKTHMRLHTGEKPYNCTHCDRQFVQVANLRRHLRVHTGEKPYKCDLCDSTFSDSNQLKAHTLIHKGEKPFTCEKCEGKFRRRHHLMHHACPMGTHGLAEPNYNYDDDEDGESLTSPSSDSMRRSRGSYEDSEFSFPSKKFRSLSSPHYDPELDKKLLRCDLPSPGSKGPSGLELSLMLAAAAAAAESDKIALSGGLSHVSSRSRKSRDPKRVRPSADHSPKSDGSGDTTNSGKILTSSAFESDAERNVVREKSFERSFQTEPEDLSSSRRQTDREDDLEEDEKENMDDLDVSTSSDRVSATATVTSTTDPTSLNNHTTLLTKVPIVN